MSPVYDLVQQDENTASPRPPAPTDAPAARRVLDNPDLLQLALRPLGNEAEGNNLLTCLYVSRFFHAVAEPIFYAHLDINRDHKVQSLAQLVRSLSEARDPPQRFQHTRKVTLNFPELVSVDMPVDDVLHRLGLQGVTLAVMHNLAWSQFYPAEDQRPGLWSSWDLLFALQPKEIKLNIGRVQYEYGYRETILPASIERRTIFINRPIIPIPEDVEPLKRFIRNARCVRLIFTWDLYRASYCDSALLGEVEYIVAERWGEHIWPAANMVDAIVEMLSDASECDVTLYMIYDFIPSESTCVTSERAAGGRAVIEDIEQAVRDGLAEMDREKQGDSSEETTTARRMSFRSREDWFNDSDQEDFSQKSLDGLRRRLHNSGQPLPYKGHTGYFGSWKL